MGKIFREKNDKNLHSEMLKKIYILMKAIIRSWIGKFNTVKVPTIPKIIYRFNTIMIKIPTE